MGTAWGSAATSASNRLSKKFTKCICKGKSKALLVSHHLPALKRSPLPCASAAPNAPTSCRQAQGIPAWQGAALPAAPTTRLSKTVIGKQFLQLWQAATKNKCPSSRASSSRSRLLRGDSSSRLFACHGAAPLRRGLSINTALPVLTAGCPLEAFLCGCTRLLQECTVPPRTQPRRAFAMCQHQGFWL